MDKKEFYNEMVEIGKKINFLVAEYEIENEEKVPTLFATGFEDDEGVAPFFASLNGSMKGLYALLKYINKEEKRLDTVLSIYRMNNLGKPIEKID